VESQKLREGHHADNAFGDWNKNMEKEAHEEVLLARKNTDHLLASDIVQQKQVHHEENEHYGLAYLFKRMFLIVRDHWKLYTIGTVFAICMYLFTFLPIFVF
jgi:ATP-binding cassette subfamily B (MDR/TAP) protein 1